MLLLIAVVGFAPTSHSSPTVTTSSGAVFGTKLPSDSSGAQPVNQFLGIPFAEPTKRWEAPVDFSYPYATSPFNATMWGSACLQVLTQNTTYGSEDCLRVNVWSPATPTKKKRAVMVFIFGGSNQFGEAEPYNMSGLAAFHDVVAVNMNYRTGPIGWMAFPEDVAASRSTGNYGILDIQSALRWVQKEIGAFGGDPSSVAIHGQSSGGGLVELQYVSPHSDGLFRAAISESGGLSATPKEAALKNAMEMGKSVGCRKKHELKECMRKLTPLEITSMTYQGSWGPTVDGVTIPRDPMAMLKAGEVNRVDAVVFGAQTNDSFLFLSREYTTHGESQPNSHTDGDLTYMNASTYKSSLLASLSSMPSAQHKRLALELYPPVSEYPAGRNGSIKNTQSLGRVESDQMLCSNRRRARAFTSSKRRGYVYRFNYWYKSNPKCSAVPNFHLDYLGSVHQDEVTFVMGQPNFMEQGSCCGKWGLSEGAESCAKSESCTACYDERLGSGYKAYFDDKEFSFARLVGGLWTSFAAHGSPAGLLTESEWPDVVGSKTGSGGIVLDADEKGGHALEEDLYGNPKVCQLWDAL